MTDMSYGGTSNLDILGGLILCVWGGGGGGVGGGVGGGGV